MCVCVCACVRACVRACVCVCVCTVSPVKGPTVFSFHPFYRSSRLYSSPFKFHHVYVTQCLFGNCLYFTMSMLHGIYGPLYPYSPCPRSLFPTVYCTVSSVYFPSCPKCIYSILSTVSTFNSVQCIYVATESLFHRVDNVFYIRYIPLCPCCLHSIVFIFSSV